MVDVPLVALYTAHLRALETLLPVHRLVLERQLGNHGACRGNVVFVFIVGEGHR